MIDSESVSTRIVPLYNLCHVSQLPINSPIRRIMSTFIEGHGGVAGPKSQVLGGPGGARPKSQTRDGGGKSMPFRAVRSPRTGDLSGWGPGTRDSADPRNPEVGGWGQIL